MIAKPYIPRKREVRKRVTIAAGILCADGIVMCADSQETYGDFKWPVKKLAFPQSTIGDFHILISGAGFGPAIDTATQKIFERTAHHGPNYEQTVRIIEQVLREIHEKDLQYYPTNDRDSLQFRLLIAFNSGGNGGLFSTNGSLVTRVDSFEIIGSGAVITNFFAHMLYRKTLFENPDIDTSEGAVLAAFLVHLAKAQLTSIGGKSQLAMITAKGMRFANVWEVPALESIFTECLEISSRTLLDCANPYLSGRAFTKSLKENTATLRRLKRSIVEKRAYFDKLWSDYNKAGVTLFGHTPRPSDSQTSEDQ